MVVDFLSVQRPGAVEPCSVGPDLNELLTTLRRYFSAEFTLVDAARGEVLHYADGQRGCDWGLRGELCRQLAQRGTADFIAEEGPVVILALPIEPASRDGLVAVGTFLVRQVLPDDDLTPVARALGCGLAQARTWIYEQIPWSPDALRRIAALVADKIGSDLRAARLQREVESLSLHLSTSYEEISLLYRLTQKLKLSSKDDELARIAVEWLADVIPAKGLGIQLVATESGDALAHEARTAPLWITHGECPVDGDAFGRLVERHGPAAVQRPLVINAGRTGCTHALDPGLRELVMVPLSEGSNVFGWLAAFNHGEGNEFGTVEASLLSSVSAILGIHCGNTELYRQQAEFLAGVVRALTSAIDAKDPYTCGHSDRVARVGVRLAEELGCTEEQLKTLYLGGLLHDVGKIGIDDNVLRKPDKLTEAEYEHIKEHPEIGYRILRDLKKLEDVLPVVLHHHEQWDGGGYPSGLAGADIPLLPRILAVADAFDAMGSDRPYRPGMPDEKLDAILRNGAGKQWDAEVVDAFFRARDEIREISHRNRKNVVLDIKRWGQTGPTS